MSSGLVPWNVTLPPVSGLWSYKPWRQAGVDIGWNASYSESPNWPPPEDLGAIGQGYPIFRTQNNQAQVSITFEGTGLVMCYTDGGAETALSLDGDAQLLRTASASSDPACKDSGASTMAYATGLDLKSHTAVIRVAASADHEYSFMGGMIMMGITAGTGSTSKVIDRWIDDTDPVFVYQPGLGGGVNWDRGSGNETTAHNKTVTFNCGYTSDHAVTTSFTGAGAAILWGYAWRDGHDYQVDVSGGNFSDSVKGDVSTTGWLVGNTVMWARGNLDPARTYTITLRDFSEDNERCEGYQVLPEGAKSRLCCTSLDGLQLFSGEAGSSQTQETSPPEQSGKKSLNLGALLGGIFGGLALVLAVGATFLFCAKRKRNRNTPQWDAPRKDTEVWLAPPSSVQHSPTYEIEPWAPVVVTRSPPPAPVSESYKQVPSAPSASERSDGTLPLGSHDLNRVVSYVRRNMNRSGAHPTDTLPPPYRGS